MLSARNLPVLMYHHVSEKPGLVTISPVTFHNQMKWLAENGWKTITASEMEYFYQGGILPRKSVMLTFDDGYLDNWLHVFPVLMKYNLNAHIFLITGLIGNGEKRTTNDTGRYSFSHKDCEYEIRRGNADSVMMRWSEIREMIRSKLVEFHLHTHTHQRWDRMSGVHNPSVYMKADLQIGIARMKEMIGTCSRHLCWPEGFYNNDYISIAETLGFSYLYTTERRMNNPSQGSIRIGRISTKERESTAWLKRRLFYYTTPFFSSLLALHKGPRLNGD
ncbi:polysaccharide deacetylase family protein [Escherichia coli]|uniref:polysaccharide deacetylase family protein n=1 Tax=Escherichia coli TaxID=562 RepID=UPI00397E6CAA